MTVIRRELPRSDIASLKPLSGVAQFTSRVLRSVLGRSAQGVKAAQRNPVSSRATAVMATVGLFPRPTRRR